MSARVRALGWIVLAALPATAAAQMLPPGDGASPSATWSFVTAEPTRAKRVDGPGGLSVPNLVDDVAEATCVLRAWNLGAEQSGIKGVVTARVIDVNPGNVHERFRRRRVRTNAQGEASVSYLVSGIDRGTFLAVLIVEVDLRGGRRLTKVALTCAFG